MPELTMPCGKYKGEPVIDLPSDYLRWIAENWSEEKICVAADEEYQKRTDHNDHFYND